MVNDALLFVSPFVFGVLVGLITGMSVGEGTATTVLAGLLGTGFILQIVLLVMAALTIDSAMLALLGFSLGGLAGLAIGIILRVKTGIVLRSLSKPPTGTR